MKSNKLHRARCRDRVPIRSPKVITAMQASSPQDHDERLLSQSLEALRRDSRLEYKGEFGAEITTFIPFVAWLKQEGLLQGKRIKTYEGMRPYYFFLGEDELEFKADARHWVPTTGRNWPSNSTYEATARPWHIYPDYRTHYARRGMTFQRPVIFIQNKFTIEWNIGPVNYIPVRSLLEFLEQAKSRFTVVYSRPGSAANAPIGYSRDRNRELGYPDGRLTEKFPDLIHLERMCADQALDYNQTKLELLAKSNLYIAVQGGGAHLMAAFGHSLMLMLDREENLGREGREYPHAYQHGPYKYLSKVPPKLLVTRSFQDYIEGMEMMLQVKLEAGSILIPQKFHQFVERWSL